MATKKRQRLSSTEEDDICDEPPTKVLCTTTTREDLLDDALLRGSFEEAKHLLKQLSADEFETRSLQFLRLACVQSNISTVQYIVDRCGGPNREFRNQNFTLHAVCNFSATLDVVQWLCENGADHKQRNSLGSTPFLLAVSDGNIPVMDYLYTMNPKVLEIPDYLDATPLYFAAQTGELEAAKWLCEKGANPSANTSHQFTPLHIACEMGNVGIVKYLCSLDAVDPNSRNAFGDTPFSCAAPKGNLQILSYLYEEKKVKVNFQNVTGTAPLHSVALTGQYPALVWLCSLPEVDINVRNQEGATPLFCALEEAHFDAAMHLCDKQADTNIPAVGDFTPLMLACQHANLEMIQKLHKCNAAFDGSVNHSGLNICHIAVAAGSLDVVDWLQTNNLINLYQTTEPDPIWVASQMGNVEMLEYLIERNVPNINGVFQRNRSTPLRVAVEYNETEAVKCLLKYGADLDHPAHIPHIIFLLCGNNSVGLLDYVLEHHEVDLETKWVNAGVEWTPMIVACAEGGLDIVEYLHDVCGCTLSPEGAGQACIRGAVKVVEWLQERGVAPVKHKRGSLPHLVRASLTSCKRSV